MLTNGAIALLPTEKLVEEIVEWILVVRLVGTRSTSPAMWTLFDDRFSIDIYDSRLQLFGDLRELIRELLRRRNAQGGRIRPFLLLPFHSLRDNGSDENTDR